MPESAEPESAEPEPAVAEAATPGDAVPATAELGADERAELERLRAEVADLRSQVAQHLASPKHLLSCHLPDRGDNGGVQWWRLCSL